jgi:hypothetical protein
LSNDEVYDLVIAVADGSLDAVEQIVIRVAHGTRSW